MFVVSADADGGQDENTKRLTDKFKNFVDTRSLPAGFRNDRGCPHFLGSSW